MLPSGTDGPRPAISSYPKATATTADPGHRDRIEKSAAQPPEIPLLSIGKIKKEFDERAPGQAGRSGGMRCRRSTIFSKKVLPRAIANAQQGMAPRDIRTAHTITRHARSLVEDSPTVSSDPANSDMSETYDEDRAALAAYIERVVSYMGAAVPPLSGNSPEA